MHTDSIEFLKIISMPPVLLLPNALSEMFAQISVTGEITVADRYGLMAAILAERMTEEEMRCLDRLLYALCRGRLKVVNTLSAVIG